MFIFQIQFFIFYNVAFDHGDNTLWCMLKMNKKNLAHISLFCKAKNLIDVTSCVCAQHPYIFWKQNILYHIGTSAFIKIERKKIRGWFDYGTREMNNIIIYPFSSKPIATLYPNMAICARRITSIFMI